MDVKDVREVLNKIKITVPEGQDISQEGMDAFIQDVIDSITDENIKEKLEELALDKSFEDLVKYNQEEENE